MSGYCPEPNRDEWLDQGVKTYGLGKSRPQRLFTATRVVCEREDQRGRESLIWRNTRRTKLLTGAED